MMVGKEQVERAILRIDNYIEKHKGNDSLYKMYDIESKYQTKLIQTFKQLKLQDVMWWTKISDRYIKGVPDILCCVVGQFVYLELKAKGNTASPLQKYNMELIEKAGGTGCIGMDLAKPLQKIRSILKTYDTQL